MQLELALLALEDPHNIAAVLPEHQHTDDSAEDDDRRVPVELPDLKGPEEILKVHPKKIRLADDLDIYKIARIASCAMATASSFLLNDIIR